MQSEITAPFIAINRHRLTTDGEGVTTLVGFHGCPLHCEYCLNAQCLQADGVWCRLTPGELYSEVEIDDLYFVATPFTFRLHQGLCRDNESRMEVDNRDIAQRAA